MTQYPEGWLARELGLCYANVSLITDYDVGVPGECRASPTRRCSRSSSANNERLRELLFAVIPRLGPPPSDDLCVRALEGARV